MLPWFQVNRWVRLRRRTCDRAGMCRAGRARHSNERPHNAGHQCSDDQHDNMGARSHAQHTLDNPSLVPVLSEKFHVGTGPYVVNTLSAVTQSSPNGSHTTNPKRCSAPWPRSTPSFDQALEKLMSVEHRAWTSSARTSLEALGAFVKARYGLNRSTASTRCGSSGSTGIIAPGSFWKLLTNVE